MAISVETVENPFRFPGQYYDQETGLHYNYFRYYNPTTGRYITPDPIGLEGGDINPFSYWRKKKKGTLLTELNNIDLRKDIFTIQYDDFGRKNQTTSPDTGTTKYQYDGAGNPIQRMDAQGTVVNYTYDALNRLAAIQFPADPNQNVTFTYDSTSFTYGIGRLTGRTDPSGSNAFHYDAHGNLTREEKIVNNILYTTQFGYDRNNNLTSITYPSGRMVTYIPDGAGRIFEVRTVLNGQPKTLATSISYLPFGGITGLTYGNTLTLTQGYDNQYRVSSIVTGSILNLTYGYDPNGNITSIVDSINPPGGQALEIPGTYSYQTGTNKLTHIEGTPPIDFGYDLNGNITSETGWTYVYDLSNQLYRAYQGTTLMGEYTYNGAGQRIKKVAQAETRIFHYDLQGHLIAETNQSGQMLAENIYLGDQLLAMIKPGELAYYFHHDHLGTPQVLTNDSQAIAWKAVYTPFGEAMASIATVENPFRFPGQYYDSETGLHYNYFRYYNPQTGRYVTPDPIGLEGGINLYAYTNNPVNFIDPLGLRIEWNHYVLSNLSVIRNLIRLNQEIINLGKKDDEFVLSVSGGDRFIDSQGNVRSITTYEIVPESKSTSPHLVERGARAVDLCVTGVTNNLFDRALKNTQFLPENTERYRDRSHTHISLPNSREFYSIGNYAPLPK